MKVRSTIITDLGLAQLELSGHVTWESADTTRRMLDAVATAGMNHVIIDLRDLDDVDPHLALALLDGNRRLAREGGWLWLIHGAGNVGSALRLMGVHERVSSSPSRAAAGWQGSWLRAGTKVTPRRDTGP
jgi:anti-anti-sigma regulatory factor